MSGSVNTEAREGASAFSETRLLFKSLTSRDSYRLPPPPRHQRQRFPTGLKAVRLPGLRTPPGARPRVRASRWPQAGLLIPCLAFAGRSPAPGSAELRPRPQLFKSVVQSPQRTVPAPRACAGRRRGLPMQPSPWGQSRADDMRQGPSPCACDISFANRDQKRKMTPQRESQP